MQSPHLIRELFYYKSQNDFQGLRLHVQHVKALPDWHENNGPSQQEACSAFPHRTDTPAPLFITGLARKRTWWSNVLIKRMTESEMSGVIVSGADVRYVLWFVYVPSVGCYSSGRERKREREVVTGQRRLQVGCLGVLRCYSYFLQLSDVIGNISHSEANYQTVFCQTRARFLSKQLAIGQLIL